MQRIIFCGSKAIDVVELSMVHHLKLTHGLQSNEFLSVRIRLFLKWSYLATLFWIDICSLSLVHIAILAAYKVPCVSLWLYDGMLCSGWIPVSLFLPNACLLSLYCNSLSKKVSPKKKINLRHIMSIRYPEAKFERKVCSNEKAAV